ncbi:MAG: hypothetical protein M0R03_17175 [Novosphingobium sp.]|nr:hypothetical protein [Novosphingobium sp.]
MHKQVWIKVNSLVDEGIAEIVSLLNTIDGLMTIDSCEGQGDTAYIYFRFGNYQTICEFLFGELAPKLKKYEEDVTLAIESSDIEPIGKISFKKELTNALCSTLRTEVDTFRRRKIDLKQEFLYHLKDTIILLGGRGATTITESLEKLDQLAESDIIKLRNINIKLIDSTKNKLSNINTSKIIILGKSN